MPANMGGQPPLSFDPSTAALGTTTLSDFLIGAAIAIAIGALIAAACSYRRRTSRGFQLTIIALPLAVQTVVTLVSGNVGAGIAVLGAFSLVRFRSMAGTPRDMATIFVAMACGICVGMDCAWMGAALAAVFSVLLVVGELLPGHGRQVSLHADLATVEAVKQVEEALAARKLRYQQREVSTCEKEGREARCKAAWDLTLPNGNDPVDTLPVVLAVEGCLKASLGKPGESEDM